jgi:tagatose-6-phosphate ketose/aldose isomerase
MTFNHPCSTWKEILRQPAIWRVWSAELAVRAAAIRGWIKDKSIEEIWLCGAGTSAFIGDIIAASTCGETDGPLIRAVPTTDFVACPSDHVRNSAKLLVIQFGRSGDSSETVGMLDLLDQVMPQAHRLHITCNAGGALATRPTTGPGEQQVLLLPEETHDTGFAMTSSFTTMLLSALACVDERFDPAVALPALSGAAEALLAELANQDAPPCPPRMIFLGAGALKGLAREAALKVLELTAGQVMVQWDSPLGFRHGPKAAVVPGTHIALMVHPDDHTSRYDRDVINELRSQYPGVVVTTFGADDCDFTVPAICDPRALAVLYVLASQVWAVRWSAHLGLNVDNPFAGGTLSRVVSGVTLYPWAA